MSTARSASGWTQLDLLQWLPSEPANDAFCNCGHPRSPSWTEHEWEDDDRAWYAVAHHPHGLSRTQVGELMGLSPERVRQIEVAALEKLRVALEAERVEDEFDLEGGE